jgi:hypothetical protein
MVQLDEALRGAPVTGDMIVGWRTSTRSIGNGQCVQVARRPDGRLGVRDSKDSSGPVLSFPPGSWRAFVASVKVGRFDLT